MLKKDENGWKNIDNNQKKVIFNFSEEYKSFLDSGKTERKVIQNSIKIVEKEGFIDAEKKEELKAGDKIYYVNRGKNLILAIIGKDDIVDGANFVVSHVDSPRLDLKQNPLMEDEEFALFKTHYYGGIKKYQWLSIPLALHGTVILKNGEKVEVEIGENESDPVFTIPDILPHLARKLQGDRKSSEVVKGEELLVIVGSTPSTIDDKEIKEKVKYLIIEKLNERYGMVEEDFISAEFEIVPAFKAKDIGFDRALVGAYGQDDRVCAFASLKAILNIDAKNLKKTAICYMADKEEIGSTGSTGLQSNYIEHFMLDIIYKLKKDGSNYILNKTLWNSRAISADVNAGINPIFKSVHDKSNAAKLGHGITVTKYTGSGGKYSSNDADAEFVWEIGNMLDKDDVKWQTGMLGKVDEGGGGTVAMYLSHYGIKTIDAGPALLAMHSPFEVASKFDIYETYRAYKLFFE